MVLGSTYKLVDPKFVPPTNEEEAPTEGIYISIGQALRAGEGTIVIMPGVYEETLMLTDGHRLLSLMSAKEVLEGEEDLPVVNEEETQQVVICGMSFHTISIFGGAEVTGVTVRQRGPGSWFAVLCCSGASKLERCDIDGATNSCVGIVGDASPTLSECRIHGSFTACGVCAFDGGQGTLSKCSIYWNALSGVEVAGEGTELRLEENEIKSNRRDGVLVLASASCKLVDNKILRNFHSGVEVREGGTVEASGNQVKWNNYGVLVCKQGKCKLENNEIFGNFVTGVEISECGEEEEGGGGGVPELITNNISCNLEAGLKIWYKGGAKLEKNTLNCNMEEVKISPRSKKRSDMGEMAEDQPRYGVISSGFGSNVVRELKTVLHPPPPREEDPTLGVEGEEESE
ncbi:hypothetical protein GUITHDRAFT_114527 [Guillardia theta CCMP2712]|uniref:Right handed beta helix domain-containing protein n=1 Tax=Guillardia theta (strain CCMP2712) TaxID=905079 RepID=L1ISU9_GUITC|nr:hypothetical protein GUITHDRAFT_114527 [Guillardia theta CCMP2712]EKX39326.1 hypothetical protein GUITHDRAFT_114527 [Guillardia theta CCMP2712]|eukprot:XP_005826306.1 hypothetical protein GUITHDRAFT_114527 [Guillardia theta CCMP2712]